MRALLVIILFAFGCKNGDKEKSEVKEVKIESKIEEVVEEVYHIVESRNPDDFELSKIDINFFKNRVFEIGPSVEVNKCKIIGECDCCMSDLITFDNDFYYISYCLDETAYFKGSFEIDDDRLLMIFEEKYLSEIFSIESDSESTTVKVEKMEELSINKVNMLMCNNKRIINLQYDESNEFGVLTSQDNIDYIEDFKSKQPELWLKFVNL